MMPPTPRRILRESEVEHVTGLSRVQRWRKRRRGEFPAAVELGPNSIGYFEDEILQWLEARPRRSLTAVSRASEVIMGHGPETLSPGIANAEDWETARTGALVEAPAKVIGRDDAQ